MIDSSRNISPADYTGDTELLSYISPDIDNAEDFFSSLGLICRADDNGRVYPYSNAATSVLDALRFAADSSGIRTVCDFTVSEITKTKHGFIITNGETQVKAKRVIIAAGGKAAEYINNGEISLDTAPTLGKDELYGLIKSTAAIRASLPCEELLTGIYHKRVGQAMLKKAGIPFSETCGEISDKDISVLCNLAKDSRYPIRNVSDWSLAQITCGGIPANEVSDKLESLKASGLYLCGEILNIQGKCGGLVSEFFSLTPANAYNLDWVWKSGYTAGMNASLSLSE